MIKSHVIFTYKWPTVLQPLVERKKSAFWMGHSEKPPGDSSHVIFLAEEARFGPAKVWKRHPNRQAWENGDLEGALTIG